jgi:hypothetical protein
VDPTTVVGLIQRPVVTATYANVSNIDLTVDPGVVLTSANTNIAKVTAADTWGASRIQAVGAGTVNIVATYGGISTTNSLSVIAAPALRPMHRWSFFSDASDSVGNANGEAFSAPITNHAILLTGTQVPMSYLNLPRDLIAGYDKMTIEVFSTPGNVGTFGRLFDFGDHTYASANYTGTSYLFLTSTTGGGATGRARVAYLPAGGAEVNAQAPNNTAVINTKLAVTITIDSGNSNMVIYTNGIQAGTLTNSATMTTFPTASLINNFTWLGRSAFAGDANWNGTIDDFRIYYGVMPSNQVTANFAIGPDPEKLSANQDGLGNVIVSWADMPPFTTGWTLQRTLGLAPTSWSNVGIAQVTNAGQVKVTVPIGVTNTAYFRLAK